MHCECFYQFGLIYTTPKKLVKDAAAGFFNIFFKKNVSVSIAFSVISAVFVNKYYISNLSLFFHIGINDLSYRFLHIKKYFGVNGAWIGRGTWSTPPPGFTLALWQRRSWQPSARIAEHVLAPLGSSLVLVPCWLVSVPMTASYFKALLQVLILIHTLVQKIFQIWSLHQSITMEISEVFWKQAIWWVLASLSLCEIRDPFLYCYTVILHIVGDEIDTLHSFFPKNYYFFKFLHKKETLHKLNPDSKPTKLTQKPSLKEIIQFLH